MHVYLHVPFCARRCSYCDFAISVRRSVPSARYAEAVLAEWRGWQPHPAWIESPEVATVYFGGGTPSLLEPDAIARLLAAIRADRAVAADAEITLEANPDDISAERADAWRAAGINRVSLGVQSFNADVLAWMHRTHGTEQAGIAVATLRAAGISAISVDLIFGLPTALGRDWDTDLDRAFALEPDHLSLYGLTVESGTALARWVARGESTPVDEDRYAIEFLAAHERLTGAGFEHYEVSNAARPGRRARHNSAYWRRAPYIGLGPSAHSAFGIERRWNRRDWADYDRAAAAGEPLLGGSESLSPEAERLERLYLGLRTVDGLAADLLPPSHLGRWLDRGWASVADGIVRLTPEGWLRLDALVAAAA